VLHRLRARQIYIKHTHTQTHHTPDMQAWWLVHPKNEHDMQMQATTLASTRSPTACGTCLLRASQLPRETLHRSALRALLKHTASCICGGQFCLLSVEIHLDTSLSLLLSTRYYCAGSLWHIKQLSAHQAAKECLQDVAEWLIFPTYMQLSMNI